MDIRDARESDSEEDGEEIAKAHQLDNPLELVKECQTFEDKKGRVGTIRHFKVKELPSKTLDWCLDLLERNMKRLYKKSQDRWKPKQKKKEMTHERSRYLIAFINDKPVAFSHFRFDMDYGRQVLYCYEIQLEPSARRFGLGRHVMKTLEKIAEITSLPLVVLTVFKFNLDARKFFNTLGYEVDETCPEEEEERDYFILSKRTTSISNSDGADSALTNSNKPNMELS